MSDFDIQAYVCGLCERFGLFNCNKERECVGSVNGRMVATRVIPGEFTEELRTLRGQAWYKGYSAGKAAARRESIHNRKLSTKLARLRQKVRVWRIRNLQNEPSYWEEDV